MRWDRANRSFLAIMAVALLKAAEATPAITIRAAMSAS